MGHLRAAKVHEVHGTERAQTIVLAEKESDEKESDDEEESDTSGCSKVGENCQSTGCCTVSHMTCFEKNWGWYGCKASCTMGVDTNDPEDARTAWSCVIHPKSAVWKDEDTEPCDCP